MAYNETYFVLPYMVKVCALDLNVNDVGCDATAGIKLKL